MRTVTSVIWEYTVARLDTLAGLARRALVGGALVAVSTAFGARAQDFAHQADSEPDEFWDPSGRAQISGQILVGVMIGPIEDRVPEPATFSALIADHDMVCLALISQDGSYRYMQDYVVAQPARDEVSMLEYVPAHPDAFESGVPFALRLSLGHCAEGQNEIAIVAASAEELAGDGEIAVLVNGLGADRVRFSLPGAGVHVDCTAQASGRATGFDFECPVPRPAAMGTAQAVVERFLGPRALDPVFFTLIAQ